MVDGITRRHLRVGVTPAFLPSGLDTVLGRDDVGRQERTAVLSAVHAMPPVLDVWVNEDGSPWRETLTATVRVDLRALGVASPRLRKAIPLDGVSALEIGV